jgi:hypothetical protein
MPDLGEPSRTGYIMEVQPCPFKSDRQDQAMKLPLPA